jgi:hypothetical protein
MGRSLVCGAAKRNTRCLRLVLLGGWRRRRSLVCGAAKCSTAQRCFLSRNKASERHGAQPGVRCSKTQRALVAACATGWVASEAQPCSKTQRALVAACATGWVASEAQPSVRCSKTQHSAAQCCFLSRNKASERHGAQPGVRCSKTQYALVAACATGWVGRGRSLACGAAQCCFLSRNKASERTADYVGSRNRFQQLVNARGLTQQRCSFARMPS